MSRKFTITTPAETVRPDAEGRSSVIFTVTNTSGAPQDVLLRAAPLGETQAAWLSVQQPERQLPSGGAAQVPVSVTVPPPTKAGRYPFRLDVVSAQRGGEDNEAGSTVTIEVPPPEIEKFRWWRWAAIAALLLVIGVAAWLVLRPDPDPEPERVDVPPLSAKQEAEAVSELRRRGLVENVVREESKEHAAGTVIRQEPEAGARLTAGEKVTIVVAEKPKAETVALKLFWSGERRDNFTTATPEGEAAARAAGYVQIRTEGYVYPTEQQRTVPLKLFWLSRWERARAGEGGGYRMRTDNFSTATPDGEAAALASAYALVRTEGYVFPSEQPGTVPLKLFWNGATGDNFTTATPEGEAAAQASGYAFVRVEGYVFKSGGAR